MKSTYSKKYSLLLKTLVNARKAADVTQTELAAKLYRPQSFVSKVESGERRLDVIELLDICGHIGLDPHQLLNTLSH